MCAHNVCVYAIIYNGYASPLKHNYFILLDIHYIVLLLFVDTSEYLKNIISRENT